MAKIKIGFSAIKSHEAFAMLGRIQRTGINIEIWVTLLDIDAQATGLQEASNRSGRDTLSNSGKHTTSYEHIFSRSLCHDATVTSLLPLYKHYPITQISAMKTGFIMKPNLKFAECRIQLWITVIRNVVRCYFNRFIGLNTFFVDILA